MTQLHWVPAATSARNIDPYTEWFLRTAFDTLEITRLVDQPPRDDAGNEVVHFLTLVNGSTNGDRRDPDKDKIYWPDPVTPHRFHAISLDDRDFSRNLSNASPRDFFDFLGVSFLDGTEVYSQLAPLDRFSIPKEVDTRPVNDAAPCDVEAEKAVIVGVIDDGINIAHELFRDVQGRSRVDYAWHMDGVAETCAPSQVLFGRQLTRAHIDHAIQNTPTEEKALRKLGLIDPASTTASSLSKRFGHGTNVLGQLAGYPLDPTARPHDGHPIWDEALQRRIVAVQLPRRVTVETSGSLYALFALAGLRFIVERARRLAKAIRQCAGHDARTIPLVINFSYGLSGGPHNGHHLVERMIEDIVREIDCDCDLGPVIFTLPAGNRYLSETHAMAVAGDDGNCTLKLHWATPAGDRSANYLEIWVPESARCKGHLELRIEMPGNDRVIPKTFSLDLAKGKIGEAFHLVPEDDCSDLPLIHGRIATDDLDARQEIAKNGDSPCRGKIRVLIALAPTYPLGQKQEGAPADRPAVAAPPGQWRIRATMKLACGERIEAWIQRDDTPPGFRRQGLASTLEAVERPPQDRRRDLLEEHMAPLPVDHGVTRYGALNGMATGRTAICVAGMRIFDDNPDSNLPALYSGAASDAIKSPDLAAPADRSRVFAGIVGASTRSGGTLAVNGTSVAAPMVGRAAADFLSNYVPTQALSEKEAEDLANEFHKKEPFENDAARERFIQRAISPSLAARDAFVGDQFEHQRQHCPLTPAESVMTDGRLRDLRGVARILKPWEEYPPPDRPRR